MNNVSLPKTKKAPTTDIIQPSVSTTIRKIERLIKNSPLKHK